MAAQIAAVEAVIHPIASPSERIHLHILAITNGITTLILAAAFIYQRIKYRQSASFWLFRFIDDNGFRALTTNVFSLWIPVCTIHTVMEMVSCIWQLNHHVPGGDNTGYLAFYLLARMVLMYLAWVAACAIIFSGFRVWSLDRSRDGRKASFTLNTYFYHLASFVLPTLFFGAVLTITFIANDQLNHALGPGQKLIDSIKLGVVDQEAAAAFKLHALRSQILVASIRYMSIVILTVMLLFFQPAAIALILAIRKNVRLRLTSIRSNGSSQGLASTQKVLIVYTIYTSIWFASSVAALFVMTADELAGNTSSTARFNKLYLPIYINAVGALISAIILGGRSFMHKGISDVGGSNSGKRLTQGPSPRYNEPLQLTVVTQTHAYGEEKVEHDDEEEKQVSPSDRPRGSPFAAY